MIITEELKNKFLENPLNSKHEEGLNAEVIAKIYIPFTEYYWLITEAQYDELNDDWLLFGYCHLSSWNFSQVKLSEISSIHFGVFNATLDTLPERPTIENCLLDIINN